MTVITNASDTQVEANLKMVFDPVENKNKHNSINIYDRVKGDCRRTPPWSNEEKRREQWCMVRMEKATVDVSEDD